MSHLNEAVETEQSAEASVTDTQSLQEPSESVGKVSESHVQDDVLNQLIGEIVHVESLNRFMKNSWKAAGYSRGKINQLLQDLSRFGSMNKEALLALREPYLKVLEARNDAVQARLKELQIANDEILKKSESSDSVVKATSYDTDVSSPDNHPDN